MALAAASCTPSIEYPPPAQKELAAGEERAGPANRLLRMSDPQLQQRIVADIGGGDSSSSWRWTNQHPRLKMSVEAEPWLFHAGFTVPGVLLQRVGTVTLTFLVNGHVLGSRSYSKDGHYEFTEPISPEILQRADPVVFGFDVDPVYIAEGDGAKLGVLLETIGFRKAAR